MEGGEVEALDVGPDDAGGMVGREEGVQGHGAVADLLAVGEAEAGPPAAGRGGRRRRVVRWQVEEGGLLGGGWLAT